MQTTSLYGVTTGISEGSLYIDVDTDSHSVVSLSGEEDTPKEYMFATGMMSSLYESVVWEELTGIESVSTISILAKAQEENIDILLISKNNLDTEIEKLNTDEATKQTVINAVNSGKIVTIPTEDITMDDWHGTGYIITNPETGAGAYMISGGLNGGATTEEITFVYLADIGICIWDMMEAVIMLNQALMVLSAKVSLQSVGIAAISVGAAAFSLCSYCNVVDLMWAYAAGDETAAQKIVMDTLVNIAAAVGFHILNKIFGPIIKAMLKSKLMAKWGDLFLDRMARDMDDWASISKFIKELQDAGVADDIIKEAGERHGKAGLDFARNAKTYGVDDDITKKILAKDGLDSYTDDVLELLGKHPEYADDILGWIDQYGKKITDAIAKHGDDLIDIFVKYGDDAIDVIAEYGDEAVDGFKNGKTPTQVTINILTQNAKGAYDSAVKLSNKYGYGSTPKKTVAFDGNIYTLSGWKTLDESSEFTRVSTSDVIDKCRQIGHNLRNAGANDQGIPGQYNASHAEKQLSLITNKSIGISQPMCVDCQEYFVKLASYHEEIYVTVDPIKVRIFYPDGRIDEIVR